MEALAMYGWLARAGAGQESVYTDRANSRFLDLVGCGVGRDIEDGVQLGVRTRQHLCCQKIHVST